MLQVKIARVARHTLTAVEEEAKGRRVTQGCGHGTGLSQPEQA